ncbi:MAG TPA: hypothetical protein VFY95_02975 [Sphingomicrobium sp.]
MRRFIPAATLLLAACATAPRQPQPQPSSTITPSPHRQSDLLGMTANELVQRFGNPALQVREGASLKLQFRRRGCVLDAYLYAAPAGGVQRVAHVDTRWPTGADADQQSCISALQSP